MEPYTSPSPPETSPVFASSGSSTTLSERSTTPSDLRVRHWSSPLTSVRSLFRRRGSSTSSDPAWSSAAGPPVTVFFLWNTLPESVRFRVVGFVDVQDICAFGEVSWEAYEFSRSGMSFFVEGLRCVPRVLFRAPVSRMHSFRLNFCCEFGSGLGA